jgi:hypothetical protein
MARGEHPHVGTSHRKPRTPDVPVFESKGGRPMSLLKGGIVAAGFLSAALPTESHELDLRCSEAVRVEIQQGKPPLSYWAKENPMAKLSGFFSIKIDGCVATTVD